MSTPESRLPLPRNRLATTRTRGPGRGKGRKPYFSWREARERIAEATAQYHHCDALEREQTEANLVLNEMVAKLTLLELKHYVEATSETGPERADLRGVRREASRDATVTIEVPPEATPATEGGISDG